MKGYYVVIYPLSESKDSGIWRKVQSQLQALNNAGLETKLINFDFVRSKLIDKIRKRIFPYYYFKYLPKDFFNYNFYYFRYPLSTLLSITLIRKIKQARDNKIIIEIPTYPYEKEYKGLFGRIALLADKHYRRYLKNHVDLITTYSLHKKIYNIPAVQIVNGIDCSLIPIRNKNNNNSINLIAVANFSNWHGYDRVIKGLKNYYEKKPSYNIYLHLVGDGPELIFYKELVKQYNLTEYIVFYGILINEELTKVYNKSDIAICSLGNHRKDIYFTSELKSREYLARGIPMISSTKIDVLPDDFKYCFYVPEDESPVDMFAVVKYYQNLIENNDINEISREIRNFAENNCDMSITMKPIISYLLND